MGVIGEGIYFFGSLFGLDEDIDFMIYIYDSFCFWEGKRISK